MVVFCKELVCVLVTIFLALHVAVIGQNPSFKRKLSNPNTIHLSSGSRVEFHVFYSKSLEKNMDYSVFLPGSYDLLKSVFPVVYFLHGINNDHTSWCTGSYGNLPEILDQAILELNLPEFIMLHPSGERGYYTDSVDGQALYERAFQSDFIKAMENKYRIRKDRAGRAIGGTSMGGYGALKMAFKHSDFYSAVAVGSPIILAGNDPQKALLHGKTKRSEFFFELLHDIYGNPVDLQHWKTNRLENLVTGNLKGLRVMLLYGTADRYNQLLPLEEGILRLDKILKSSNVDHQLHVYAGEPHGWRLISSHLPQMLQFLTSSF